MAASWIAGSFLFVVGSTGLLRAQSVEREVV
jgi:hypothetical protein